MSVRFIFWTNILLKSSMEAECLQHNKCSRVQHHKLLIHRQNFQRQTILIDHLYQTKENQITGDVRPCAWGNRQVTVCALTEIQLYVTEIYGCIQCKGFTAASEISSFDYCQTQEKNCTKLISLSPSDPSKKIPSLCHVATEPIIICVAQSTHSVRHT